MLLKVLLFVLVGFVVNMVHFKLETGVPALAPVNLLFLLTLLAMRGKPDPVGDTPPLLKQPLLYFFAALTYGFLLAQVRAFNDFIVDATYLKNAVFYPLFYFLYRYCKQDEKTTRWLIIWVLVVAAVAGFEAIREGLDYGFDAYNPTRRASGPFGEDWRNSNRAGVFYAMFIAMFAALALFLKHKKLWRLAALGGCVLLAGGALFTYSRQAYFMIMLAVALLLLRKSLIVAVVVGAILMSFASYLPDAVTQRVDETKQTGQGGQEEVDTSTASRWEIWAGAMKMLKDNPLGVGLNRFKTQIGNYTSYKGFDAHNFYVLTLAEMGPFGLITLVMLIRALFKLASFLRQNTPKDDPETLALTLGFTITTLNVALGGLYGSPTLEGSVMAPYWALAGLLERYIHLKVQGAGETPVMPEGPSLLERFPLAAHILPGRRSVS